MAASNQWVAVTDSVSSISLAQMGFAVVSTSLSALSALGAANLVARGPGGYRAHITDLEMVIKSWETFLQNLSPSAAARIDADCGPGSVQQMRARERNLNIAMAAFIQQVDRATIWEKCSWRENGLSEALARTQRIIRSADADFRLATDRTKRELIYSMVDDARGAPFLPTPMGTPSMPHAQPRQGVPTGMGPPGPMPHHLPTQMPPDLAASTFDQLVRFTMGVYIAVCPAFPSRSCTEGRP
ncbi:hypothetical protein BV20DRAFT_975302 [Pilatotrama ljubarskyi]|nr:hypothetical protein BV20DRAFT_975302 [Pilatotrama ljubarskyi]